MNGRLDVALRIKRLREDAGLSQSAFAGHIGIESQSHVSKIETGEVQPSIDVLNNISSVFNVTIDFILKGCVSANTPSSENKFYVGYNAHMTNNIGKDALRYLNKCIQSIQELDEQSRPEFKHAPVVQGQATGGDSDLSASDEATELEKRDAKIAMLEKELAALRGKATA